ncbi:MAG: ABC transporter transmembrane domain-containing protein, partial [Candidatus Xenobia bacterium]
MSSYDDEVLGKAYDARLARRLLTYAMPHRRSILLAVLLVVGTSALDLAGPLIMRSAIDRAIQPGRLDLLPPIAALYLAVGVAGLGLKAMQSWVTQMMGQRIMERLRQQLFEHLMRLPIQ